MAITRRFIDWSSPVLPATADFLMEHYARSGSLDLSNVLVVVPGGRAGRLLLEILVERSESDSLAMIPPRIETIGRLPEHLYDPQQPFAPLLVQRLAWTQSLLEMPAARRAGLIPRPPDENELLRWMELGDVLRKQYVELAADGLDFGNVADREWPGFPDQRRWQILSELQTGYLDLLRKLNYWDKQTARMVAIRDSECRTDKDIVLVATVDIHKTACQMLDQVADRVVALVHAPETRADHFDKFGCLLPSAWQDAEIPLDDSQIQMAGDPGDQAASAATILAAFEGQFRADEITIGVPDDDLLPKLQRQLHQVGVASRPAVGTELSQTRPFQLLSAIADFIASQRYRPFAALLRHVDVAAWIDRDGSAGAAIDELDRYFTQHLPSRFGKWLGPSDGYARIREVYERLDKLLGPLQAKDKPLPQWSEAVRNVLTTIYDGVKLNEKTPDHLDTLGACRRIGDMLAELADLPDAIPLVFSSTDAIQLLLDQLRHDTLPPPAVEDAIELLGWLELPTDTAPALIVTSMNEGLVSSSRNADLFLPDSLRQQLDLLDNARRYARDVYALSVLVASRKELILIAGRRNGRGDPLIPSRLLFAGDDETLVRRSLQLFVEAEKRQPRPAATTDIRRSPFVVPRPVRQPEPPMRMRVTAFRDYLACPYRFYLRHVLNLQPIDDTADELDPASFGVLIHDVAQSFAESDVRESASATEIREFLWTALDKKVARRFGREHLPAVDVQLQQCKARLAAFAEWQADRRAAGWQIEMAEEKTAPFDLKLDDGRSIIVSGRIDRIDRNTESGDWEVLDYKTFNTAKTPEAMHRKSNGEWVDLQLPLYRHLAAGMGIKGPMRLGYIVLPKDLSKVGLLLGEWKAEDLADADAKAAEVARHVLDQKFWPPSDDAARFFSEYAVLCQDNVFGRVRAEEEAE